MHRVLLMAFFCLPSARALWAAPTGRALAFVGARAGAFRHVYTPPPALTLRATHEATEASATTTVAVAAGGAVETALEMKARLGVGKAKNVGRGPSPYTLGVGARSGLPPGCPSNPSSPSNFPPRLFTVLGIETSCDDTGAAVVRSDGCVLGEALASQHLIHAKFGGVVPGLARDAHEENIDAVIGTALAQVRGKRAAERRVPSSLYPPAQRYPLDLPRAQRAAYRLATSAPWPLGGAAARRSRRGGGHRRARARDLPPRRRHRGPRPRCGAQETVCRGGCAPPLPRFLPLIYFLKNLTYLERLVPCRICALRCTISKRTASSPGPNFSTRLQLATFPRKLLLLRQRPTPTPTAHPANLCVRPQQSPLQRPAQRQAQRQQQLF
jgi:hypothetical protein